MIFFFFLSRYLISYQLLFFLQTCFQEINHNEKLLNPLYPKKHSFQYFRSKTITHNILLDGLLLSSIIPILVLGKRFFFLYFHICLDSQVIYGVLSTVELTCPLCIFCKANSIYKSVVQTLKSPTFLNCLMNCTYLYNKIWCTHCHRPCLMDWKQETYNPTVNISIRCVCRLQVRKINRSKTYAAKKENCLLTVSCCITEGIKEALCCILVLRHRQGA